jgi:hypothetical protein
MSSTDSTEMDSTEQFESDLAELNELADRHITTLQTAVAGSEPAAAVDLLKRAHQMMTDNEIVMTDVESVQLAVQSRSDALYAAAFRQRPGDVTQHG